MKIEKEKVVIVLNELQDSFPGTISSWKSLQDAIGSALDLTGYLVYLKDHGYIEGKFTFVPRRIENPWSIELPTVRINATGIDYLVKLSPSRSTSISQML